MKKLFLTTWMVSIFLIGGSCTKDRLKPHEPTHNTPSTTISLEEFRATPDTLEWKVGEEVRNKISTELSVGKNIREIVTPQKLTLPPEIYPPQLVKYFQLGDIQFAIVNILSGVTLGQWDEKTTTSSGVWYADKNDIAWKPLIILTQLRGYRPHNNIFDFWNEGQKLHIMLVDSYGAGSGEGSAKILASSNELDENWKTERCFYFIIEVFFDLQKRKEISSIHETIPLWLNPKINKFSYNRESIYNSSTDNFEYIQLDKWEKQEETIIDEGCKNVVFPPSTSTNKK